MNNGISTDNKLLRRQGARLTALGAIIGCTLFVVIDTLPLVKDDPSGFSIGIVVILAFVANLLSLPFSIIGGNALGWFLEKTQWYKQGNVRIISSGVLIASATVVVIFAIGAFIQLFLMAHMHLDVLIYIVKSIVQNTSSGDLANVGHLFIVRFMRALVIAVICGGIIAWRLSQLAQQQPA